MLQYNGLSCACNVDIAYEPDRSLATLSPNHVLASVFWKATAEDQSAWATVVLMGWSFSLLALG